jgi:hypothetical protein
MISAVDARTAVLNVAWSLRWVAETNPPNRGEAVDAIIRVTGLDPATRPPWCAAFVAYVGYAVLKELWPLAKVAGCVSLSDDAVKKGLRRTAPARSSIFLLWSPTQRRFHHTGFCVQLLPSGKWKTTEGNTNAGGSPEGTGVFIRERTFGAEDRFIAWWEDFLP